ncbi:MULTISPECIES: MFS transporter [unclassified Iodidimonas]|jgi:MFS family permease|uniref:MFS transporter n=1 Tax=unclassified Iodidimonas TaxID=2626145 RepID=UPI0024826A74|nr:MULTISPECIES: MFS transporter [unclassified Iodidimonas]
MRPVVFSIFALLLCAAILQLGNGLQFTLIPIRAQAEQFGDMAIATLGTGYFAGFLLGCIIGAPLIGRLGHVRVLTAVLAALCALALLYPLVIDEIFWMLARVLTGTSLAIAYMAIESWLNERAPNHIRGALLSLYSLVGMVMLALGQFLLMAYPLGGYQLFSLVAITSALAALPVALTRAPLPVPVPQPRLRMGSLLDVSRVAVVGSIAVGFANSSFWAFGPIFAARMGMAVDDISLFMALTLLGGAVLMWPIGHLSDRYDRRKVAGIVAAAASLSGLGLVFFAGISPVAVMVLGFLFGAFAFTIQPICIAHANDQARPENFVSVSGGLLFLYGASSLFGPLATAVLIKYHGPLMMFGFTAFVHGLGALVIFALIKSRAPTPDAEKEDFQLTPRTTMAAFQLHDPVDENAAGDAGDQQADFDGHLDGNFDADERR